MPAFTRSTLAVLLLFISAIILSLSGCGSSSPTANNTTSVAGTAPNGIVVTATNPALAAPTGVTANSAAQNTATISWSAAPGATSYNIYRALGANGLGTGTKIATVPNTSLSYNDTLTYAGTYYYAVTSVDATGESANSTEVSVYVQGTPTGLKAVAANGQASISWTPVTGATGYNIYYSTTTNLVYKANSTKIANIATSSYTHTGLVNGTTYYYAVDAILPGGLSGNTVAVSVVPTAAVPAAPATASATVVNPTQINVTWATVSGVSGYNIYRNTAPGVAIIPANKVNISPVAGGPFGNNGLTANTTYYYVVTSINGNGESIASPEVSAATGAAPLTAAPTGVSATGTPGSVTLSWTPVPGAVSYNVYYSTTSNAITKAYSPGTKITNTTAASFIHTGLTTGQTYYYAIDAVDANSTLSYNSATVSAVPTAPIPVILSFSPASGTVGSSVTITGYNFDPTPANNTVKFNGTATTVSAASSTSLTVTVPAGATTGTITVATAVGTGTSAGSFTVAPTITGFNPTSGVVGSTVTITGTNFNTTPANNTVRFNGTAATVSAATATSLTVTVPAGATTGSISVTTSGGTATSAGSFTVLVPPTITGFSPTSSVVGNTVTITGTNFNTTPANNTVKFNGTAATVSAATATSLTVTVPAGATTGTISVTTSGGTATSAGTFTVLGNEVYVTNMYGNSITVYTRNANGNITPLRSISGPSTGLDMPGSVSIDTVNNELVVVNSGTSHSITTYNITDSGNVAPKRMITSSVMSTGAIGGCIDTVNNEIYVAGAISIYVFNRTDNGVVLPKRTITGTELGQSPNPPAIDTVNNELIVTTWFGHNVLVYPRLANGNSVPLRVIAGAATGLNTPAHADINMATGEIFVANSAGNTVTVYNRLATGNVAPLRTISGGMSFPYFAGIDSTNNELFVANWGNHTITVYTLTGTMIRTISGAATGLNGPSAAVPLP